MIRRRLLPAALAAALACVPRAPTPPPVETAPPPAPAAARARYGPEPAAAPTALERAALDAALPRLGGRRPAASGALTLAARALAEGAAAGARDPLSRSRVRLALASALAYDAAPVAHLVETHPDRAAEALAERVAEQGAAFTHAGAGAVVRGSKAYLVLLLSRRPVTLAAFPREVAVGESATLRGELAGLSRPTVHLTAPSGASREVPAQTSGPSFSAPVRFDARGRWLVEVVGEGARGPTVAALLTVACGGVPLGLAEDDGDHDPDDLRAAEGRVVAAIQAARTRQGVPPLEPDRALADVARRHSEAMLKAGVLAHVLPGSNGPGERLRKARVPFALALENVAVGDGALAAHRAAEESPAHRQNILSRDATRVGVGAARGRLPGGDVVVYLTELFTRPPETGEDDRLTPEARVREALWAERARRKLPPLATDARLDALAREAARDMARHGEPSGGDAGQRALALGRKVAAVDAFVVTRAVEAAGSHNLADPRFGRVGVGVTVGESARYGPGMLFIAVVYTD